MKKQNFFDEEAEEDVYGKEYLQESIDNDEIDSVEEGFMNGYLS